MRHRAQAAAGSSTARSAAFTVTAAEPVYGGLESVQANPAPPGVDLAEMVWTNTSNTLLCGTVLDGLALSPASNLAGQTFTASADGYGRGCSWVRSERGAQQQRGVGT